MAYPFDETFASGIPAGFGSVGGAGGITATWNGTAQAVDLVFSQAQNFWKLTAAEFSSDFWCEVDVEILAAPYTPPHFGFWLWDGVGTYEGYRIATYANLWIHANWTSSGTQYDWADTTTPTPWAIVGARKTLRLDARKSAEGDWWDLRVSLDGAPAVQLLKRYYTAFLPCLFGFGLTLRLHRAAGGTPSALAEPTPVMRRALLPTVGRRILVPEHAAALRFHHRGLRPLAGTRNHYYHGNHRITGTVKEKGPQTDLPVSRRVLLLDERANFVVRETWSDAATGAYAFDYLNPDIQYLVIAYDHQQQFRAAVADNLTAEPMP